MAYLKTLLLAFVCLFVVISANAQHALSGYVFAAGGFEAEINAPPFTMTAIIGEVIIDSYSPSGYIFSNGLLQPSDLPTSIGPSDLPGSVIITAYPNPARNYVELSISDSDHEYTLSLYDLLGSKIGWDVGFYNLSGGSQRFNLPANLKPGIYLLSVKSKLSAEVSGIIKLSIQ